MCCGLGEGLRGRGFGLGRKEGGYEVGTKNTVVIVRVVACFLLAVSVPCSSLARVPCARDPLSQRGGLLGRGDEPFDVAQHATLRFIQE